jgi:hypothetical protein
VDRYESVSGKPLESLHDSLASAVEWIGGKRVRDPGDPLHHGLLPAGFSAEHLGPNDHYYWDDFWAEAGLDAAERIFSRAGREEDSARALALGLEMRSAIERSLKRIPASRSRGGIPASPYRRMDAGAIGSLVADYPLQLFEPGDARILATVEALMRDNFHKGGFFQDVIHSGMNAYLTLDIAQTLLRAGDPRYRELIETVAGLATPTGQWPEAIHPHTLGGCMGDGQHGWSAAEWLMMMRNCFVREEIAPPLTPPRSGEGDGIMFARSGEGNGRLIIGSGLFAEWFESDDELRFGPTLTPWGAVTVRVERPRSAPTLYVDGQWREQAPRIDVAAPGFALRNDVDVTAPVELKDRSQIVEMRR